MSRNTAPLALSSTNGAVRPAFQSVAQACPKVFAYRSIIAALPGSAIAHGAPTPPPTHAVTASRAGVRS